MSRPYQKEFEYIFLSHSWGDKSNAGVNYRRKPKDTTKKKGKSE
jgi:hypothetical protein